MLHRPLICALAAAAAIGTCTAALSFQPRESAAAPVSLYVLQDCGGEVCVYQDGQLLRRTGIPAAALPQADRDSLTAGIALDSPAALAVCLEDFGG